MPGDFSLPPDAGDIAGITWSVYKRFVGEGATQDEAYELTRIVVESIMTAGMKAIGIAEMLADDESES